MKHYFALLKKIQKKNAKIGIIGLGYVGLPLAIQFSKKKFDVLGFDIDKNKIKLLKKNRSYIKHIPHDKIKKYSNKLSFTDNFSQISKLDIIILCLPTPLNKNNNPDLSFITITIKKIKKYLKEGQILILESSTYPGSTKKTFLPVIKKFKIGINFFVGYSPEREDPNNKKYKLEEIPKICSGYTKNCSKLLKNIYSNIVKNVVSVSNIETAEFTKLYENIFRNVNIGLVNELKILSNKLGLDIYEIIKAAKTKPFGFQAFYPGPGVGGHCIPVDPYYMSFIAKKKGVKTDMIFHSGKINSMMPKWIINQTIKKLDIKKTLILGVAYKKNIDDVRESPAISFINILKKKKISVDYFDPFVKKLTSRSLDKPYFSIKLSAKNLKKYDCVFVVTNHSNVNYKLIKNNSKYIIDTRNAFELKDAKILKL